MFFNFVLAFVLAILTIQLGCTIAKDGNLHPVENAAPAVVLQSTTLCEEGSEIYGSDCWCSKGYYSDNGLSPCNQCDFGSYSDVIGGKLADCKCHDGFYSSTGSAPCDTCPEGTDSKIARAATSCTCKPGYTGQGDAVPESILRETALFNHMGYFDLHNFYNSHAFSAPCSKCPINSGTYDILSPLNSRKPDIYPNYYNIQVFPSLQSSQGNVCMCDPNTKSATGYGPCDPCSEGSGSVTIAASFYGRIYDNIEYFYDNGGDVGGGLYKSLFPSIQMNKCYCKAGFYSPDGTGTDIGGNCASCPFGKVSLNNDLVFHRRFDRYGQLDYSNPYPYPVNPLNTRCLCQRNFYKNLSVAIPLTGHVESSNDCILCPEGGATSDYDDTSCTVCDVGYYSPNGLYPCAKCPDGLTTAGYQQTSCSVTSTYSPTIGPTPSPTPSSPSITNPPIAYPTRAPVQSKKPTAHPTTRPTQPNQCLQGYFSSNGFNPGCHACPNGTTTSEPGMTVCDICSKGYYGRFGEPPCTACPESSTSNDERTMCTLCVGYEQGCTTSGNGRGYGNVDAPQSNLTARVLLLEKRIQAQQAYIERYNKQRNQVEL